MKLPKEYILIIMVGLFLLSYLMDAVTDPLPLSYPTPYHYFTAANMSKFAFATAAILIRAFAFVMAPIWLFSFFNIHPGAKGGIYLVLGSLMQLYALQEVATNARLIPFEWAMSLSAAGVVLLPVAFLFIIIGLLRPITAQPTDQI